MQTVAQSLRSLRPHHSAFYPSALPFRSTARCSDRVDWLRNVVRLLIKKLSGEQVALSFHWGDGKAVSVSVLA